MLGFHQDMAFVSETPYLTITIGDVLSCNPQASTHTAVLKKVESIKMEDIIAEARAFGKKIAQHPRSVSFMSAAKAVAEDKEAQRILQAFQEQVQRVQELEASGKPIEVSDKHKLTDLQSQVASNDNLKTMMKHQADYLELMHHINRAIDEATQGQ